VGEINSSGKAVGFHYERFPGVQGRVIRGTESEIIGAGYYTAGIEVNGIKKSARSSFFPKSWEPQDVVDAINEAYAVRSPKQGYPGVFLGTLSDGTEIEMILDSNNKIKSVYPVLDI
jgi:toxin